MIWDEEEEKSLENPITADLSEENAKGKKPRVGTGRRTTECLELSLKYEYRRAFSETKLLDACKEFKFSDGHSYNFITAGDVDSLSYLKAMIRAQDLDYCLLSTWCMAAEDIYQLREWMESGKIKHLDCYVGEIFPSSYKVEYKMLSKLMAEKSGRLCVFKNHSKIYAGYGKDFYFGIQTSANINTNPRTENGCITISKDLFGFYKNYFDNINSFV